VVGVATATVSLEERARAKRVALSRHPLLAGCSHVTLRRVAAFADEVRVVAGEVVVEQGRHGLWFFMIESGRAEVVHNGVCIGVLGPGDYFGEAAVLRQVLQPATVRAVSDMTLYVVGCQRLVPIVRDSRALRSRLGDVVTAPRPAGDPPRPWAPWRPPSSHGPPDRPIQRRRGTRWVVVGALASAAALAAAWHPPLAVVAPGHPFDVANDISIAGAPTTPVHGRYLVPTVKASRPTVLGLGLAMFHPHRHIVGADEVSPPGTTAQSRRRTGESAFRRSQLLGSAAGARAAGVNINTLTVRIRTRAVTGPSAGLAYALAVEDMLDSADLANGRTIAATGEVLADGHVAPVGFVGQKAPAATGAGATVLLVPDVEVTEAWGNGLRVDGVSSVADAVAALR
jgi:PDZ domain-containing secreted protein